MLIIYNTLNKKKEKFTSIISKKVGMYVCGVTVYDLCHIGHARAYVSFDIIRRYLKYIGYEVKYIQNFTDVDDKIINRAKERGISPLELAKQMIDEYFIDMDKMNIQRADNYPKVTEHIQQIIDFIKALEEKNKAYEVNGDVYFSIKSFDEYGKLSARNTDDMLSGARVEINCQKESPLDFALWKKGLPGEISWDSPWGKGRPGWHIECSAMSREYLGETFDIHGGGQDLIFPHHENEIAQSEALTGKTMSNYWVHNGFVKVDKEKMSKSLDNFFTLRDVIKEHDPMVLRLFFLMTHYRAPINYSTDELVETKKAYEKIRQAILSNKNMGLALESGYLQIIRKEFREAMNDDFNTAKALAIIFGAIKLPAEFIPIISSASICSVTRIVPISEAILEPTLPAKIKLITRGANSRIMESRTATPIAYTGINWFSKLKAD